MTKEARPDTRDVVRIWMLWQRGTVVVLRDKKFVKAPASINVMNLPDMFVPTTDIVTASVRKIRKSIVIMTTVIENVGVKNNVLHRLCGMKAVTNAVVHTPSGDFSSETLSKIRSSSTKIRPE